MCETSLRRIFIPPFQQLKEFRGHLAIWNCQLNVALCCVALVPFDADQHVFWI